MTAETDDLVDPNADPLLGFDDFQVSLGDTFRGERATQGVSLLDVQRDLRIKAEYLAAIEDANPDGFDGKGFIAGYVRSYARYLHLDPDWAFRKFCSESGFRGVHGFTSMSERAPKAPLPTRGKMHNDASLGRAMPRVQPHRAWYNDLDPAALRSAAVLIALVALIEQLAAWQFTLFDAQLPTNHLARFGISGWSRDDYLSSLAEAIESETRRGIWRFEREGETR